MWQMTALGSLLLLFAGWLWWARQEGLRTTARQLEDLINEARIVSQDMEAMLSNAVDLSKRVLDDFEQRFQAARETMPPSPEIPQAGPDPRLQFYRELSMEECPEAEEQNSDQAWNTLSSDLPRPPQQLTADIPEDRDGEYYRKMHPTLAVNQLHNQGLKPKQIAQLLSRGQGEVELILNLTRKKRLDKAT